MPAPVLPVIRSLGGCGGTLLSRMFGALPHTIVLSETNPRSANLFGGFLNPLAQLRKWWPESLEGLANFDEAELGYPPKFGDMLERLHGALHRQGRRLILRDFNYADFLGIPFIWPVPADFSLDAATRDRFQIRQIALVRNPAEQLASLRAHRSIAQVLTARHFVAGSLRFLEAIAAAPVFRYEDMVAHPEPSFRRMCAALDIEFDPAALDAFHAVTSVTGNLARAAEQTIAAPPRSAAAEWAEQELRRLDGYPELRHRLAAPDLAS